MQQNILDRLVSQLKAKGMGEHQAYGAAVATLKKSGNLDGLGHLTVKGRKRSAMGADGRAKDRASKGSGHPASDFVYNPSTNRATLRK